MQVLCPNQIPSKAFKSSITFRSDDIDVNQHVNNAVYVASCLDVASKAISSGVSCYHTSFGNDFNPACLIKLSASYYKQCFEHQIVDVFTWQSEQDNRLHFVMKHFNSNVFYMTGNLGTDCTARL